MKIAIYGTSRSGKDYQISHIISHLNENDVSAIHIPGSTKLNELADEIYGSKFKELSDDKKHHLREEFINLISDFDAKYEVVFVDGHFAFPSDVKQGGFDIVFTESDKNCYDHFFYLDTDSELIIKNSRQSVGDKKNTEIQTKDIEAWKAFEISAMQSMCSSLKKELVILDEDTQSCVEFVLSWVKCFRQNYDYQSIAKDLVRKLLSEVEITDISEVLAIDCDNTFATNDTTYDYCSYLEIDAKILKKIFVGDRYSSYQFFKANKLYTQFNKQKRTEASLFAKEKIKISADIERVVENQKYSFVIALTSGLTEIWQPKIEELGSINTLYGNTSNIQSPYFVTPLFKKFFVEEIRNHNIKVTSIGDSIIDVPMLESSDIGLIVAHRKINKAVMEYLKQNNQSSIAQLFAKDWLYPVKQISGIS